MQRRERILAIAVGVLVGGWLLDGAVISPTLAWYDGVRDAASTAEAEVAQAQALIDRQARIMADWRARHAAGLLDDEASARYRLQSILAEAARSSGVAIDSIGGGQLIPAAREETCDTLRLTASGQGGLGQIMDFMRVLASAGQPLRIERSELSAQDPRKDLLELSLTVSTRVVATAARSGRSVPEGTRPWQPGQADAAPGLAVVAAKPFLAERRGGRSVVSDTARPVTVAAPGGWVLVGIVTRTDRSIAFLRHLGDGSERQLATGEEIDGRTASMIDAGGMILGEGDAAKRITVGHDLTGEAAAIATPVRRPATPVTTTPAAAGTTTPISDTGREAILERLRQQRNRTP